MRVSAGSDLLRNRFARPSGEHPLQEKCSENRPVRRGFPDSSDQDRVGALVLRSDLGDDRLQRVSTVVGIVQKVSDDVRLKASPLVFGRGDVFVAPVDFG